MDTQTNRARIIIADDHQAVLETVATLLAPQFDIVGTARDGAVLLDMVARLDPNVVVLDISMPVHNGLEVARRLKTSHPWTKVVFLTIHDDEDFMREARAAGAAAYILKANMTVDLVPAIREALAGRTYMSANTAITNNEGDPHQTR